MSDRPDRLVQVREGGSGDSSETTGSTGRALGPDADVVGPEGQARPAGPPGVVARLAGLLVAAVAYLALAVGLWWHAWSSHPSITTTCGCGDASRFLWFLEWPVFAVGHGHQLLYSPWLFHPTGINLLSDTSVLGFGVPLAWLTWLTSPVVTMNVASTLAPFLSALTLFWLLTRWRVWGPAAFVGGLVFGFSPLVIGQLAYSQLNTASLFLLPLLVGAIDALVVRSRARPVAIGVALGLLVVAQFFLSTEILLISLLSLALGVLLLGAYSWHRHLPDLRARCRRGVVGLATAIAVAGVLLAYPLWFLLAGPAHLSGEIWATGSTIRLGNSMSSLWSPQTSAAFAAQMRRLGGYQGPPLPWLGYLGFGTVVVVVAGCLIYRRDRRIWLFAAVAAAAGLLALGPRQVVWAPWRLFGHLPWVGNIVEVRFSLVVDLCAGILVALVLDNVRRSLTDRGPLAPGVLRDRGAAGSPRGPASLGPVATGAVLFGLAALVVVPVLVTMWPNLPLTMRRVELPEWFETDGRLLPPGRVLLVYPAPFSGIQSSQAWQALDHMRFQMAGGGGPQGVPSRAGDERAGFEVLSAASLPIGPAPLPTGGNVRAIREALAGWQVTTLVVPDQAALPPYDRGRSTSYAVGLFTSALGRAPVLQHRAWVWPDVAHPGPAVLPSPTRFSSCTSGLAALSEPGTGGAPTDPVAACILTPAVP